MTQGPQRRIYEVMSFCNDVVRYQVPLHPFHRFVYTNALLLPVREMKPVKAAAISFCRLLRNWPKAVFLRRLLASDLAVPLGHEARLKDSLDQLTLVANEKNHAFDVYRSPRMSELPNAFRLLLSLFDHRRATDTRFCRGRELLPTSWAARFLHAPQRFDLSRWPAQIPRWEPVTELWAMTPVMASY